MGFKVNPKREVTFHHKIEGEEEPIEFSVTFRFVTSEDIDYVELRRKAANKTIMTLVDKETGKEKEVKMGTYNAFLYSLRCSLISWNGFVDMEGTELPIKDGEGNIIAVNQIAVFEAAKSIKELFDKIVVAYVGTKEKNS